MANPNPAPNKLSDLSFPEQLTLWSLRFWSDGFRQNYSPYETLREAYARANCPAGLLALDNFLSLVVAGHSRVVDFRCPCCGGISEDEWRLLQSLALVQSGGGARIADLLSHFLEPATARIARTVIYDWAGELKESGLVLPMRDGVLAAIPVARAVTGTGSVLRVYANRGNMRLH
ncbi:hypothetical protein GQF03_03980 [Sneathiella chungangensis]|uniref:Uncharacterized protein n=1 Tax=Sneathiella chungangensis TaxID=1418234 RepID=A0A845MCT4_9PROT|nr:hypothetical protein [Sneathiella chungangensis]MZR21481.1 hypothetical protein [Sneathiella chungangensis]